MIVPKFLQHLPLYGDLPVPFIMLWVDGKPDFRAVDSEKLVECYRSCLCGICGRRIGEYSYFIGGDACKKNHTFLDPAMHKVCAEFSVSTCPFLSGKRTGYSDRPIPGVVGVKIGSRPSHVSENIYIFRAYTKRTKMVREHGGGVAFLAGQWLRVTLVTSIAAANLP